MKQLLNTTEIQMFYQISMLLKCRVLTWPKNISYKTWSSKPNVYFNFFFTNMFSFPAKDKM